MGYLEVRGKRSLESAEGGNWATHELQGGLMGRHRVTQEARDYWLRQDFQRFTLESGAPKDWGHLTPEMGGQSCQV